MIKKNFFNVTLLSARNNYNLICKQINKYKPRYFIITNPSVYKKVRNKFKNKTTKILDNYDEIRLRKKIDISISAIPGIAGLLPTLKILKSTKKLLLANKESVICGWNLIRNQSKKFRTKIIPIDSEHFSILKIIENFNINEIKNFYYCFWWSIFKL